MMTMTTSLWSHRNHVCRHQHAATGEDHDCAAGLMTSIVVDTTHVMMITHDHRYRCCCYEESSTHGYNICCLTKKRFSQGSSFLFGVFGMLPISQVSSLLLRQRTLRSQNPSTMVNDPHGQRVVGGWSMSRNGRKNSNSKVTSFLKEF